jgi:hypothetical protein
MMLVHIDEYLTHDWYILGAWLMHLFMVQVDYRLRYRLMHG